MKFLTIEQKNMIRGKYCKGCAWLHIGIKVDHNHCDYDDSLDDRPNGLGFVYSQNSENVMVLMGSEKCRYYWDKKSKKNPSKEGIFYKSPEGSYEKCPKIPYKKEITNG